VHEPRDQGRAARTHAELPDAGLDRRRYMLTDSLDDLRGSRNPVIGAGLIAYARELAVLTMGG
jgi:hypothetical protein